MKALSAIKKRQEKDSQKKSRKNGWIEYVTERCSTMEKATGFKANRKEVAKLVAQDWKELAEKEKNRYRIRAYDASRRDLSNNVFDTYLDDSLDHLDATGTVPTPKESTTASESEPSKLEHSPFDFMHLSLLKKSLCFASSDINTTNIIISISIKFPPIVF
ncbi:10393_t:CDS:1 [Acaulospora morrowiae]|uniref:10393_t:CDS:1 n=1 Tax=Acaulospora morrowiae TaxID=94023 RepID=A0A9N9IBI9_9GLOM|nr:10393_t:CDS:1 [Acaulospora morrowiae]